MNTQSAAARVYETDDAKWETGHGPFYMVVSEEFAKYLEDKIFALQEEIASLKKQVPA